MATNPITEAETLVAGAVAQLEHALTVLRAAQAATTPAPTAPVLTPAEEKLRHSAYLHQQHLRTHGTLTQGDSLKIRRDLYGKDVRSTANQFGKAGENANFYRDVPYGKEIRSDQPIKLTARGEERAEAYRAAHNLP